MEAPPINQQQIQETLSWIDSVPLSRTPKNITRDFSDGFLVAQLLNNHMPHLVHLHNFQPANSSASKYINWKTLNQKVFKKLNFQVHKNDIESIIASNSGAVQRVLYSIYSKVVIQQTKALKQDNSLFRLNSKEQTGFDKTYKQIKAASQTLDYAKQLSNHLAEKQTVIQQLRQTIEMLQTKLKKMQQLNKLKDAKIDTLMRKLDENIGI